jgi:hypothetical protein
MPVGEEPGDPPALGLVGVDRKRVERSPAGMGDVVGKAADRTPHPRIKKIKY